MSGVPDFLDTTSIRVFWQIPGVQTEKVLAHCLYTIDDPDEIREIVDRLNPVELSGATQRKATNWLIFRLRNHTNVKTDLDHDAGELRVTGDEWIREFRITDEASRRLNDHIQSARPLYEEAYGS